MYILTMRETRLAAAMDDTAENTRPYQCWVNVFYGQETVVYAVYLLVLHSALKKGRDLGQSVSRAYALGRGCDSPEWPRPVSMALTSS